MAGIHRNPDTPPDQSRRRFLAALAALLGLGTVGTVWRNRLGATPVSSSSTAAVGTSAPSTAAATTGATSATIASTTQAPASTTSNASTSTSAADSTTTAEATSTTSGTTTSDATTTTIEEAGSSTSQPGTTVTSAPEAGAGLILLEKQAWGAAPEGAGFESHSVERITVHHTAAELVNNSKAPARIRQHQSYHQSLGWPDLAYHVMVDREGNLYEGRPMEFRGDTGTTYDPSGHFLPCLEGNYEVETPTAPQMEALAQVCAWAADRWGLDVSLIGGHRDYAATSCPGGSLYDNISSGSLAARVSEILSSGVPSLNYLRGDAAAAVVAAIEAGG